VNAETVGAGLLGLASVALWGRLALSLLPPGEPGSHRPAGLAATWAASHALGLVVLLALGSVAAGVGLRWSGGLLWGTWCALALLRAAFLPGSMVPRHLPPAQRARPLGTGLLAVVVVLTLLPAFATSVGGLEAGRLESLGAWAANAPWQAEPFRFLAPASRLALVVMLLHGLAAAGLGPVVRRAGVLLLLVTPAFWAARSVWSDALQPALLVATGCAGAIAWLRRADRRGAALAALAFAACPAYERAALPLGAAGLLALVAHTHRNARRSVALGALGGLLPGLPSFAAWSVDADWSRPAAAAGDVARELFRAAGHWATGGPFWYAVGAAAAIGAIRELLPAGPAPDPSRRARRMLATTVVLAFAGAIAVGAAAERLDVGTFVDARFLLEAAPAGLLLVVLTFGHQERVAR